MHSEVTQRHIDSSDGRRVEAGCADPKLSQASSTMLAAISLNSTVK